MTREEILAVIDKGGALFGEYHFGLIFIMYPTRIMELENETHVWHKGYYTSDGYKSMDGFDNIIYMQREASESEIKQYVK